MTYRYIAFGFIFSFLCLLWTDRAQEHNTSATHHPKDWITSANHFASALIESNESRDFVPERETQRDSIDRENGIFYFTERTVNLILIFQ